MQLFKNGLKSPQLASAVIGPWLASTAETLQPKFKVLRSNARTFMVTFVAGAPFVVVYRAWAGVQ